ncbi:unnamed protein product [Didymodactylos carnosus]|uniref:Tetratricopeptide repeat protein n=2 Tax=Didymodactylos carnosus TaxID=1234261 RepID=A0A8S2F8U5_9BILA|nr:unnamed protein product [Didymodactylos carnosus]CAF4179131.1 unnamed protein product [Didymodactylos carnosus]
MRIDRFQIALSCYQEALKILEDNIDYHHLADMYRKMNNVYKKLDHFDEANLFETLANEIDQEYGLPFTPDDQTLKKHQYELKYKNDLTSNQRARHLYSIGLCYIRKRDYSQALENLSQAEQLYKTNRSPDTPSFNTFATLYDNLALVYLFLNDDLKALTMWKKALDIRAHIPVT